MRLPPEPVLRAVLRWLENLPESGGVTRAWAILTNSQSYGDLSPGQYASALTWIRQHKLLDSAKSGVPAANLILEAILQSGLPTWFLDADRLVNSPDELPVDILSAGKSLGLNEIDVYQQLVHSWGKVDTTTRARIGAAGEEALVALLRGVPESRVGHVSTWSDGFGYDIEFRHGGISGHLEVKSTTRAGRFVAYLSRHESNVMRSDTNWMLVAVRLTEELSIAGVGSIPRDWITANLPRDETSSGTWASCKLEVPPEVIEDGLPTFGKEVSGLMPTWHFTRNTPKAHIDNGMSSMRS